MAGLFDLSTDVAVVIGGTGGLGGAMADALALKERAWRSWVAMPNVVRSGSQNRSCWRESDFSGGRCSRSRVANSGSRCD